LSQQYLSPAKKNPAYPAAKRSYLSVRQAKLG
jgi:hypothetical protein